MKGLTLLIYLTLPLHSGLLSLPAPVNVSIKSVNFRSDLRWDPGAGTPPGTQYVVHRRVSGRSRTFLFNSTTTSFKLKLKNYKEYVLAVQAVYNQTHSPKSRILRFNPSTDTKIGPPVFSLAGCGNCVQVNMSLPEAEEGSEVRDIKKFYNADFIVLWRMKNNGDTAKAVDTLRTKNSSVTLKNLEPGVEYCVQVDTKCTMNSNTEPSAWKCIFTSIAEPGTDPVVLVAIAVVGCVVVIFVFGLYHTGFLCQLKKTPPKALIMALSQGHVVIPEGMIPDLVSISTDRKCEVDASSNPTMPRPAAGGYEEGDEEDEEDGGLNVYMDRDAHLSSGESSGWGSGQAARPLAEAEAAGAEVDDEDEAAGEGAMAFLQTGLHGHAAEEEEEEQEEVTEAAFDSGDVNLFSVTLAALGAGEEDEEELDLRTYFSAPRRTWSSGDSQSEPDDEAAACQDLTDTGYRGRPAR